MMILPLLMLAAAPAECDTNAPQQVLNQCLAREYAAADAELNRVWKPAYAEMQRLDRDYGASAPGPGYAEALLTSQRAWIAYRDAQCLTESNAMRGGSAQPMILYGCKTSMTRERTMFLRGIVEGD